MENISKVFAMIPARANLKSKNLALINGEPMISYSINAAVDSNLFDKIIINSDDDEDIFQLLTNKVVDIYKRPNNLVKQTKKAMK